MESGTEQHGGYASQPRNGSNANGPVPVAADQPRADVCHATGRLSLAGGPTDTLDDLSCTAGDGFVPESEPIQSANAHGSQTQNDESRSGIPGDAHQSSKSPACRVTDDNGVHVIPRAASGHGLPRMA